MTIYFIFTTRDKLSVRNLDFSFLVLYFSDLLLLKNHHVVIYEPFLPEISALNLIRKKQLGESRRLNIWPGSLRGVNIVNHRKRRAALH